MDTEETEEILVGLFSLPSRKPHVSVGCSHLSSGHQDICEHFKIKAHTADNIIFKIDLEPTNLLPSRRCVLLRQHPNIPC